MSEKTKGLMTRKDLFWIAVRSFFVQHCYSFSRMQGIGFLYTILPALRKIHPDKEELAKAMTRHTDFFNSHPHFLAPIVAMVIAMEEQKEDPEIIRAFKISTMGPIAGIGDALYNFMYDPVMRGIVGALGFSGAWIAFFIAFIPQNFVKIAAFKPLYIVYEAGSQALLKIQAQMKQINRLATTIGLMSIGGLSASYINVKIVTEFVVNEKTFGIQADIFDKLMPNVLSLIILLTAFWLVRSKKWNIQVLIWSIIGVALAGSYFKILG